MKIKPEHYQILKTALLPQFKKWTWEKYHEKFPTHSEMRWRWDMYWLARKEGSLCKNFIADVLYSYMNDDHIDSALRKIAKESLK